MEDTRENQRKEARRLRKEQGLTGGEISRILGIPPSTTRKWIEDIEITPEQKQAQLRRHSDAAAVVTRKGREQEEARRLRCEEGLSIKEIAQRLGVSKSSASLWVRDVQLTD